MSMLNVADSFSQKKFSTDFCCVCVCYVMGVATYLDILMHVCSGRGAI